jgi:hypothetical protein
MVSFWADRTAGPLHRSSYISSGDNVHHYMPGANYLWLLLGLTCFEMNDLAICGPSRNQRKVGPEIASAGSLNCPESLLLRDDVSTALSSLNL